MSDESAETPGNSLVQIVVVIVLIVALLAVLWAVTDKKDVVEPGDATNSSRRVQDNNQSGDTDSPDAVKESGGANSDTAPSSSGTGPGPENSLLGPNEPN